MKVLSLPSKALRSSGRLDAKFHLSEGSNVAVRMAKLHGKVEFRPLGGDGGIGSAWSPGRFKRVYAVQSEDAVPYLRPYDVFSYLPRAADWLSATRSPDIDDYRIREGMILMTCSGRNLGPAVYVDRYLARFALSHDMIRLEVADEAMRLYVLAYLATPTAQHLLRRDKGGSVIDHITVDHASAQRIPLLAPKAITEVAGLMRRVVMLREKARVGLSELQQTYDATLPVVKRKHRMREGWTVRSRDIVGRIDAAPYDPLVVQTRKHLVKLGGEQVRELAEVLKPAGRYKTMYVDQANGSPILSGAQLLQVRPINLSYIAERALSNPDRYRLSAGWLAYQADGRAEEALGEPVMITRDREGWLASGHIGRVVAKKGISSGHLLLALRTPHAQVQIKALASGSVVDSTFPADMEQVVLPPLPDIPGKDVETLWDGFAEAQILEDQAVEIIERSLRDSPRG